MNQANKILTDLQNEANYLFDENKISAKHYQKKIQQIEQLKTTIQNLEAENNILTNNQYTAINEQTRKVELFKNYSILLGGNPFLIEKQSPKYHAALNQLIYTAERPNNPIEIDLAIHLILMIETIEKETKEAKEILIKKHGVDKANQMFKQVAA